MQVAANKLVKAPLFIDDSPGLGLMEMQSKLRRLKNEHELGLVVVDYLQLMTGRGRSENRNQEVSMLSRGLKLLSKELSVPMLLPGSSGAYLSRFVVVSKKGHAHGQTQCSWRYLSTR